MSSGYPEPEHGLQQGLGMPQGNSYESEDAKAIGGGKLFHNIAGKVQNAMSSGDKHHQQSSQQPHQQPHQQQQQPQQGWGDYAQQNLQQQQQQEAGFQQAGFQQAPSSGLGMPQGFQPAQQQQQSWGGYPQQQPQQQGWGSYPQQQQPQQGWGDYNQQQQQSWGGYPQQSQPSQQLQQHDASNHAGRPHNLANMCLNDTKIGAGLKEALTVSIDKAIALLSKKNGYFLNSAVKILVPPQFKVIARFARKLGFESLITNFEKSMNRAAEKAAGLAKKIFLDAVFNMTLSDVKSLLMDGGKDKATVTDYFQRTTSGSLENAFRPVVAKTMDEYEVTRYYKQFTSKVNDEQSSISKEIQNEEGGSSNTDEEMSKGFMSSLLGEVKGAISAASGGNAVNIETYTVRKAMEGLFHMMAEEEKKIRRDPKARVTSLIDEVFSMLKH